MGKKLLRIGSLFRVTARSVSVNSLISRLEHSQSEQRAESWAHRVKQRPRKCRASLERKEGKSGKASAVPSLKRAAMGASSDQGGWPVASSTMTAPTDLQWLMVGEVNSLQHKRLRHQVLTRCPLFGRKACREPPREPCSEVCQ